MIAAGSFHSAALTVEGYAYTWGSNSRGQLGHADSISHRKDAGSGLPKLMEQQLGRGLCGLRCDYSQTFLCNSETGFYTDVEGEVFLLWKSKLRQHEEKNILKANAAYRTDKRLEKQMQIKESVLGTNYSAMPPTGLAQKQRSTGSKYLKRNEAASLQQTGESLPQEKAKSEYERSPLFLGPNPTMENVAPTTHLLNFHRKLQRKDVKRGQVYEFSDFKSEVCSVQGFKKVSYKNEANRVNCFVTSFPFSGHAQQPESGSAKPPAINDCLQNQEEILSKIVPAAGGQGEQSQQKT